MVDKNAEAAYSELMAAAILEQNGWAVALPISHCNPFDLIIYKKGVLRTVQVKSAAHVDGKFVSTAIDFRKYKDVNYIVVHDRMHQGWYIFEPIPKAGRRRISLDPQKHPKNFNNWNLIK